MWGDDEDSDSSSGSGSSWLEESFYERILNVLILEFQIKLNYLNNIWLKTNIIFSSI